MKDRSMLYMTAGISLFVGFIIFAIGIGAIFPSMHKLTAPLICRGDVEVETVRYNVVPGETVWQHTIYCTDTQTGVQKDITFPAIGVTGLVASAIIFVVLAYRWRNSLTAQKDFGALAIDYKSRKTTSDRSKKRKEGSPLERLSELKKMRDQNLISEAEYDRKKSEIMEEL